MSYKIIEVHQVYQDNKISEVAVLWQSNEMGWVRASYCTSRPCSGYKFLMPGEILSPDLIQQVAGQGMGKVKDSTITANNLIRSLILTGQASFITDIPETIHLHTCVFQNMLFIIIYI